MTPALHPLLLRAAAEAAEAYTSIDAWSDEELADHLAGVAGEVVSPELVRAWRRHVEQMIAERESATRAA